MKKADYYEICKRKLKYLNYAESTIKTYMHYINQFLITIGVAPTRLTAKDFQSYLHQYQFKSVSQQNQVINAIRFLYKYGLEKKYGKVNFERPRKERKLPKVIAKEHLLSSIAKIENIKHKAIISIAYSVGLRVGEVINLRIEDIDSKRMVINIIQSKGKKDRVVPLTSNILQLLRTYFKEYQPVEYLFEGQNGGKYSQTSCNNLVKKYIGHQYHFHQLRHSCFTNLIDCNVNLRSIQKLAGHASSKTTERYTQVSRANLQSIPLAI